MAFQFDNTWARELPETFVKVAPNKAPNPEMVAFNAGLAAELGLDPKELQEKGKFWFSGASLPEGADPIALAYSGHQFGGFSPLLGDGRAHLLGEFITPKGERFDLQLKGSGRTPFSRGGDGKAVLGPMLREYLISEAMAALAVPTTRSLAVTTTGKKVFRDYHPEKGAIVARVAQSHLRVGSFQFAASRGDKTKVKALADYAIARHYPDLSGNYLAFFDAVTWRQGRLIAQWMGLGFIHGVMNTDNMTISGETIDYGPCAFMDAFSSGAVFSSIDRNGRYAWGNQPHILAWNLARLAESLLSLLHEDQDHAVDIANARLGGIAAIYRSEFLSVMAEKLGVSESEDLGEMIDDLLIAVAGADWTLCMYHLGRNDISALQLLFTDFTQMEDWLRKWGKRLTGKGKHPAVIPRNHRVEEALAAANEGDFAPFHSLFAAITQPFVPNEAYMQPPTADFGPYKTFCGT